MLGILKNIIWTHSYSMSRSHKKNCCWDGMNGLKNAFIAKQIHSFIYTLAHLSSEKTKLKSNGGGKPA